MVESAPTQVKRILTIDGGGVQGVLSLKLLESLEARITSADSPARNSKGERPSRLLDYFDMVAGTSTGAIVVGLLELGHSPSAILEMYKEFCPRFFRPTPFTWLMTLLRSKYSHAELKRYALRFFGDVRLWQLPKDIMIVARDMVRSESTFFTAFRQTESDEEVGPEDVYGTYKMMRLRDAVLASASAPTYFPPHDRFVDGAVGSFINSCLQAAIEALAYSAPSAWENWIAEHPNQPPPADLATWERKVQRYQPGNLIVYSFGTGHVKPLRTIKDVKQMRLWDWAKGISSEFMGDINEQQSQISSSYMDVLRGIPPTQVLTPSFRLHRYQMYLTPEGVNAIGGQWEDRLSSMELDDVRAIPIMEELGELMARRIEAEGLWDEEETIEVPTPRPRARRIPNNVFVELGRPAFDPRYAQAVLEELDATR